MRHISIIAERDELPWQMFTVNKKLKIPYIYRDDPIKALCATTDMGNAYDYPNTIFVQGKIHLVEFSLIHNKLTSDYRPLLVYLPENPIIVTAHWRVVLQTLAKV
jgi:hypothetical protein